MKIPSPSRRGIGWGWGYFQMKEKEILREHIAHHKMKQTRQRKIILETFIKIGGHVSAEELYHKVIKRDPSIGLATVYRTLTLLCQCGIAQQQEFGEGKTRFEVVQDYKHHDHLICTKCGKIIEFENCDIERQQEQVAKTHRFTIYTHRLEIYGLCGECHK